MKKLLTNHSLTRQLTWPQEMRDVGNVNANAKSPIGKVLQGQGVIDVLAVRWVNAAGEDGPQVEAPLSF